MAHHYDPAKVQQSIEAKREFDRMGVAFLWLQEFETEAVADCGCRLVAIVGDTPAAAFYQCDRHAAVQEPIYPSKDSKTIGQTHLCVGECQVYIDEREHSTALLAAGNLLAEAVDAMREYCDETGCTHICTEYHPDNGDDASCGQCAINAALEQWRKVSGGGE